jgi:hypothetical protein
MWRMRGLATGRLAALGGLVVFGGLARDAVACSEPPPGWRGSVLTSEVPSGGLVLVRYYCSVGCAGFPEPPVITVREQATGSEVPGVRSELYFSEFEHTFEWRAADPLVTGQYEIDLGNSPAEAPAVIRVVPPVAVDFDELEIIATAEPYENDAGMRTCCPTGPVDSCSQLYCYSDEFSRAMSVSLDWSAAPAGFDQYLARVTWTGRSPGSWVLTRSLGTTFELALEEYCYTVEFKSLVDDEVTLAGEGCIAHPAGVVLGVFEKDPALIRASLGRCDDPPAGLHDAWCVARAARCAEYPVSQCSALRTLCPDAPEDGGVGDGGTPDGGASDAGDSDAGVPDEGSRKPRTVITEGCSLVSSGARASWAGAPALLGLLLIARRRRA